MVLALQSVDGTLKCDHRHSHEKAFQQNFHSAIFFLNYDSGKESGNPVFTDRIFIDQKIIDPML